MLFFFSHNYKKYHFSHLQKMCFVWNCVFGCLSETLQGLKKSEMEAWYITTYTLNKVIISPLGMEDGD